jgi:peptidoglycan/LPS O-acetylase OafA/YrhL
METLVSQTAAPSERQADTATRIWVQRAPFNLSEIKQAPSGSEGVVKKDSYRPDIDGLRAIAVLAVVLYHCGVPGFNGGFTGVDIFFVISGFLITSLVKSGIDKKSFSFSEFYERRARRLAPALAVVLLSSFAVAFLYFTQLDFELFSKSLFATSAFASNVYFMRQVGDYFAVDSAFKPLLHTWSLAVEEQFYVLYPLCLVLLVRWFNSRLTLIVVAALAASFVASCFGVFYAPEATFYLLPGRAWELLLGAIFSLTIVSVRVDWRIREALAWTGMAFIVAGIELLTAESPFPGWNAVLPCFGAALIIWTGADGTLIGRALSHRLVVFFGLISYSLYLWHWPIIIFARYIFDKRTAPIATLIIICSSVALAWLSWKFVEVPFRRRSDRLSRRGVFCITACAIVFFAALGLSGGLSGGLPQRLSDQVMRYGAARWDFNPQRQSCMEKSPDRVLKGNYCTVGRGDLSKPGFLVWGDSHADAWMPVFDEIARQKNLTGWFAAHAGCPSLLGIKLLERPASHRCQEFNEAVAHTIVEKGISDVILINRWSLYVYGIETSSNEKGWLPDPVIAGVGNDGAVGDSIEAKKRIFENGVKETIRFLTAHRVRIWIVHEVPSQLVDVPNYLARRASTGNHSEGRLRSEVLARQRFTRDIFESVRSDLTYQVDPIPLLCPMEDARCHLEADGRSLYTDNNHLSVFGTKVLKPVVIQIFDSLSQPIQKK